MFSKCFNYSVFITIFCFSVSTQNDVIQDSKSLTGSNRNKRTIFQDFQWGLQYWPQGQASGFGLPNNNQYNGYNQNNYNNYDQYSASSNYNNQNAAQTQPQRYEVKREPLTPFDFIPDYSASVRDILQNIPGYTWVESNNPGNTYTQVYDGNFNPIRDVFKAVFGEDQTDRIFQTRPPSPTQVQASNQNTNYYNEYDSSNGNQVTNAYNTNPSEVQIRPSVVEEITPNSDSDSNSYNNYNNYPQQQFTSTQQQSNGQQSTYNVQKPIISTPQRTEQNPQYKYSTLAQSSQSQMSLGTQNYGPQQTVSYSQQSQPIARPTNANTAQVNSQPQTLPVQTYSTNTQSNYNTANVPNIAATKPPQIQIQYQTKAPPSPVYSQSQGQYQRPQTSQSVLAAQSNSFTRPPAQPALLSTAVNANKMKLTTNRPLTTQKTVQKEVKRPIPTTTSPSIYTTTSIKKNTNKVTPTAVTTSNLQTVTIKDPVEEGLGFKKDALQQYGVELQETSYDPLPAQPAQIEPSASNTIDGSQNPKIENRFALDSNNENNKVLSTQPTTTTTQSPVKKCDTPASMPLPDFQSPGRRISQMKCYEYIWEQQERVRKWESKAQCYKAQNKIIYIAGKNGVPGQYPHMAAIGWLGSNGGWLFNCGGSLISHKFVLTAARCSKTAPSDTTVKDMSPKIVRLGDREVAEKNRDGTISVEVGIKRFISYPEYSSPQQYNDIALIELQRDVTFSRHVQPACLWSNPDTSKLGTQFVATGWGVVDTARNENSQPVLKRTNVTIIDTNRCNEQVRTSYCNRNWCGVDSHQICGANYNTNFDACQGDSGAPLQVKIPVASESEGSMHYVVAVTSFRLACTQPHLPAIFTRVSSFISWIENVVWLSKTA